VVVRVVVVRVVVRVVAAKVAVVRVAVVRVVAVRVAAAAEVPAEAVETRVVAAGEAEKVRVVVVTRAVEVAILGAEEEEEGRVAVVAVGTQVAVVAVAGVVAVAVVATPEAVVAAAEAQVVVVDRAAVGRAEDKAVAGTGNNSGRGRRLAPAALPQAQPPRRPPARGALRRVNSRNIVMLLSGSSQGGPVETPRGREARLRTQFAALYSGIDPGIWTPVETLIRQVTDIIHQDRSKAGVITGERLLRDEHFDFRGASPRPQGLPLGSTRLSDAGAEPEKPQTERA
jgi:hypothetical protein